MKTNTKNEMKLSTEFIMSEVMGEICLRMVASIGTGAWLSDAVIESEAGHYLSFYQMNTPENRAAVRDYFKNYLDTLKRYGYN